METFTGKGRIELIITVLLSVLIVGGCATTVKYSYDMKTSFSEGRNYKWASSSGIYGRDHLLEMNVQVLADQLLTQKGFTMASAKPDLMISISYEFGDGMYRDSYELRMLTLNIYKVSSGMPSSSDMAETSMQGGNTTENKELIWRGTAFGTISTDAASGDLKKAVQGILSNFPPTGNP